MPLEPECVVNWMTFPTSSFVGVDVPRATYAKARDPHRQASAVAAQQRGCLTFRLAIPETELVSELS
jgi:hypothetical protein